MKNKILFVKNNTHEGPGTLALIAEKKGIAYVIIDLDAGEPLPSPDEFDAVIVLGAPDSANDPTDKMNAELNFIKQVLTIQKPYLGICLGLQTLVKAAGGQVVPNHTKEIGFRDPDGHYFAVELTQEGKEDILFKDLEDTLQVFHLHGETVVLWDEQYPMLLLAQGKYCKNQIVKVGNNAYGLQCHFELTPEMFDVWIKEDADLRKLNESQLRKDFEESIGRYLKSGEILFQNFLKIAGY